MYISVLPTFQFSVFQKRQDSDRKKYSDSFNGYWNYRQG